MMNKKNLKILFMGTPVFAETVLTALINGGYNIAGVFTQSDKKFGRKQELQKSPVKILAEKNNLPVFAPEKLNTEAIEKIKELNPNIIIVAAYGKIIPQSILEIPQFKALNVHPSILPKYRGASPIQNALLFGEKETGTTIMLMNAGMDTGDILRQEKIAISAEDDYAALSKKLAEKSNELLLETIPLWISEKIVPQPQDSTRASYCKILKREDGKIDWDNDAQNIHNKYRAFSPWPGIFSFWKRDDSIYRLKLNHIKLLEQTKKLQPIGKVFIFENTVAIQAKIGLIKPEEIQMEGKKNTTIEEFLKGYPDFIGSILQ